MRREPFHPTLVFLREPFEKPDHAGGINLCPLKQLQSRQIGLSLLLPAELEGEQFDTKLFHHPDEALSIAEHNGHHRQQTKTFHDPFKSMPLQHVVQLMAQHARHFFAVFCFFMSPVNTTTYPPGSAKALTTSLFTTVTSNL